MSGLRLPKVSRGALSRDASEACSTYCPSPCTEILCDASTSVNKTLPLQSASTSTSPPSAIPPTDISTYGQTRKLNWKHLREFASLSDLVGPFKTFADDLIECAHIYECVSENQEEFAALQKELETLFEELNKHLTPNTPPVMTASIKNICNSIQAEIVHVKCKQSRNRLKRAIEIGEDAGEVLATYRRIQNHVQRLLLNVNLSTWKVVGELVAENRLAKLSLAPSARYDSAQALKVERGECALGTRIGVFNIISQWMDNPYSECVYWLNGIAGTGKTTIAYSICAQLHAKHRLAASFFCSQSLPECREASYIIPSIAYQLARFSRPFQLELLRELEENPDAHGALPQAQFDTLISRPLERARDPWPSNSIVVIDALNECDSMKGACLVLEILLIQSRNLPVKFFVSSRPDPAIRELMSNRSEIARLVLHELDNNLIQSDIKAYLTMELATINPLAEQITMLVEHAGILFTYAAFIIRLIGCGKSDRNPRSLERFESILKIMTLLSSSHKKIDDLYALICWVIGEDPNLDEMSRNDMQLVLGALISAREPLAITALSGSFKFDDEDRMGAALSYILLKLRAIESSPLTIPPIVPLRYLPVQYYPPENRPSLSRITSLDDDREFKDGDPEDAKLAHTCRLPSLDSNTRKNALPFILQGYAQWVDSVVFDQLRVVGSVKDGVVHHFSNSEATRSRIILLGHILGMWGKSQGSTSRSASIIESWTTEAHRAIKRFQEKDPDPRCKNDMDNASKALDPMMQVILIRRFASPLTTILTLMELAAPVFRRACPDPPKQLVNLPNVLLSGNINLRNFVVTDILLSVAMARPMLFRYDTTYTPDTYRRMMGGECGFEWLYGIPDQFIVLFAWINSLAEDYGSNVDPQYVVRIEENIREMKTRALSVPGADPARTIKGTVAQEGWRHTMYAYLYLVLCGVRADDHRVMKVVKSFVRLVNSVKAGRNPDFLLFIPIITIGAFLQKEQDRKLIRERLLGLRECSIPGIAGNDCLRALVEVWKQADLEQQAPKWSDLTAAYYRLIHV
ncbi:unnamed protein product [Rhizoctonia solani]|uniref:Nephrocystin 3-like N-terminal domain-containing protein n=3 Tax=Rhizoctonia solani TaxID=456999 RepID=A0A8H3DS52_9AGAM|nr:fungal-specific transcription factor domain protein [Rhizoctonia solani AG-3 Rhs1AP]KEP49120.1 fungal-specific transcription factor domain protein [Rhizoctonia solani 123E]CAE6433659.1 unnamed protein product [Rhizoctonia solani]CAE6533767.1 unnamed protein product [Rhizoctonia solani]